MRGELLYPPPPASRPLLLLGNHADWQFAFYFSIYRVYGAADPNGGTAAIIEVARSLGKLLESGWTPRRSIYLLSWSGEEYGLLGSTGWAELNSDLIERAVAYLNVDTAVSGPHLSVSATPSLSTVWEHVLLDLNGTDHAMTFANGPSGEIRDGNTNWMLNQPDELGILGSGSDFTVFLDHFGIASLDFSFSKSSIYGQYHSIYDSFSWMDRFGGIDGIAGSSFMLIAFASKIWGLLALRLATAAVLPLDHIVQGEALSHYTKSIERQEDGLDLKELKEAVDNYQTAAATLQLACGSHALEERVCNEKLGLVEREFIIQEGLPKRKWFKHALQAPGMFLGYAAEAFPGIQQAIDEGDMKLAQEQVAVVAERIQAAASHLQVTASHIDEQEAF
jgi:N-acetylated-alpha-linked acidic dipeptidase